MNDVESTGIDRSILSVCTYETIVIVAPLCASNAAIKATGLISPCSTVSLTTIIIPAGAGTGDADATAHEPEPEPE
jgi:hypothetical protein